jgi:zinc transport system substrate-binding protein
MTVVFTRAAALVGLLAAGLALAGCGATNAADGGDNGGLDLVASFYPLQWTAQQVAGPSAVVGSLTKPGAEPHDLELTPQDVARVSDADLVVYLKGFQPAVDDAVSQEASDRGFDVSRAADLNLTYTPIEEGQAHTKEAGATDPHFWLDPVRLASVGDALADRLTEADPDGAATYEQNAATLRADLEALDAEVRAGLSDCAVDTLVTGHDAFGYLGDRYGLEVVGISGLSPSAEPSPAAQAQIAELVRERGITTVYTETLVDPAVAETVAHEAGVRTAVLDPIEGLTDESAGSDYLEVMRADLATLQEGQSCT